MNPVEFCGEKDYPTVLLLTYSFDPLFFEDVVFPVLRVSEAREVVIVADGSQLGQSITRCQRRAAGLGRWYRVVPASGPGKFHPKAMIRAGDKGALVWFGSGNLTHGGWGANRELSAAWRVGPDCDDKGDWLPSFLKRIASWSSPGCVQELIAKLLNLPWLPQTSGEPSSRLIYSRPDASLAQQLKERLAARRFDEVWVMTGSTDDKGAFLRWLARTFGVKKCRLLGDPSRISLLRRHARKLPLKLRTVFDPDERSLHAKFYWLRGKSSCVAIMGSANCSAAAWLLSESYGGNSEAVLIYDNCDTRPFGSVLSSFNAKTLQPFPLPQSATRSEPGSGSGLRVLDVSWDSRSGGCQILFSRPISGNSRVTAQIGSEKVVFKAPGSASSEKWEAECFLDAGEKTVFVDIRVEHRTEHAQVTHWLNDVCELRHSARGRRFVDIVDALNHPSTKSEKDTILAELRRISAALMDDPEDFPDMPPATSKLNPPVKKVGRTPEAVDPRQLIVSIAESERAQIRSYSPGSAPVTVVGILRALFNRPGSGNEGVRLDEEDEDDKPDKHVTGGHRQRAEAACRERLCKQMSDFLDRLNGAEFAETATATQLVQAVAFPIVVGICGFRGGWFDETCARALVERAVDTLIIAKDPHENLPLLDAVKQRYFSRGKDEIFREIVGNGTLWLAMTTAVSVLPWLGPTGLLEKALTLELLMQVKELVSAGETKKLLALIRLLPETDALRVCNEAPRLLQILCRLETVMMQRWDELLDYQSSLNFRNQAGEFMWRKQIGWAKVIQENWWNQKTKMYLRARGEEKTIAGGYYLNVSRLAENDPVVSRLWIELRDSAGGE